MVSPINQAEGAAAAMVQAAEHQDRTGLSVAAEDLDLALAIMWGVRFQCDVDWQTILNHAQAMMKQLFAEKRVEFLTVTQCGHILELVHCHLGTTTKTPENLSEAVRLIRAVGCDPYWAVSRVSDDETGDT